MRIVFIDAARRGGWAMLLAACLLRGADGPHMVDDAALRGANGNQGDWLMYGRTYDGQRYSPLTQINEQTAGKLGLVWSRELETTRGLEATPLVQDGVIYTTG